MGTTAFAQQPEYTLINKNYHHVSERIKYAALDIGRDPNEIRLVVVTKTHPIEIIQCLQDIGLSDFGENYVEEAIPKITLIKNNPSIQWHMIGHVQGRKAKDVCEYFDYVHSVDSVKIANRLNRFAKLLGKLLPVWLEFNISGEQSKSGWDISNEFSWETTLPDIEKITQLSNINILGFMTIPPYSDNSEDSRTYYRRLRKFRDYIEDRLHSKSFHELSMGMSSDFEVAIQEGSTCVRIGQAILGPRIILK